MLEDIHRQANVTAKEMKGKIQAKFMTGWT